MRSMLFSRLTAKTASFRAGLVLVVSILVVCAGGGAIDALAGSSQTASTGHATTTAAVATAHPASTAH